MVSMQLNHFLEDSTRWSLHRMVFINGVTLPTGASALVIPPDAAFPCDLGDMDGLDRRDTTLDELHQNILRFIYAYAPGADTYITEE